MQGDADIFFPTDFWLLERIDHYCSGQLKMHKDNSSKQGKKRRTITVSLILLNSSVTFLTTTLQDKYSHGENYILFGWLVLRNMWEMMSFSKGESFYLLYFALLCHTNSQYGDVDMVPWLTLFRNSGRNDSCSKVVIPSIFFAIFLLNA